MVAPYIGVSGFMSSAEVRAALALHKSSRPLMVGVLASSKTLCGHANKYPLRYPKPDAAGAIFVDDPRCLNLVHLAPGEVPSTVQESDGKGGLTITKIGKGRIPFFIDLIRSMALGGPLCHGVQINSAWPDLKKVLDLMMFRREYPTARVVLQIGPRAMSSQGCPHPGGLHLYTDVVTDVLIDASGGKGVALDLDLARAWIRRVRETLPHVGIGVAGGFCGETLGSIAPLVAEYPDLSIDAEGRLRDDADGGGNLHMGKVGAYLARAAEVFP